MKKIIIKAALAVILILALMIPLAACGNTSASIAAASDAEGTIEDAGIKWKYTSSDKTLNITLADGKTEGTIPSAESAEKVVWYAVRHSAEVVNLPEGITAIGDYAFNYFPKLKQINIPSTVTSIGKCAFAFCSALETVTVPANVTAIGESCFEGNQNLKKISVLAPDVSIGARAFAYCASLETVYVKGTLTNISAGTFMYCPSLSSIILSDANKALAAEKIDTSAFEKCKTASIEGVKYTYSDRLPSVTITFVDEAGNAIAGKDSITKENLDPTVLHTFGEDVIPNKIGELKIDPNFKREMEVLEDKTITVKYYADTTTVPVETEEDDKMDPIVIAISITVFVLVIAGVIVFAIFMARSTKKANATAGKPIRKEDKEKKEKPAKRYNKDPKKRK